MVALSGSKIEDFLNVLWYSVSVPSSGGDSKPKKDEESALAKTDYS